MPDHDAAAERNPAGRPSAFRPEFVEQARKLAQLGATDREVADFFNISDRTIYNWRHAHPEFADALQVGKKAADDRVEMSLYRKATGYSYDAVKIMAFEGVSFEHAYVEHVPPSDTACIFWLKNRKPKEWRDKVEHEHGGGFIVTFSGPDADL